MRKASYWILIACLSFSVLGCMSLNKSQPAADSSPKSTPALLYWQKHNKYVPLVWAEADLNGDERQDTVLIYQLAQDKCQICVILDTANGFVVSESSRAPLENQTIKFKDIDQKQPLEIIVSGSKNGKVGYGILRLEGKQLEDLFAEGMEECC